MSPKFKKFATRSLFILYILLISYYLLICLVPFLSDGGFWFIAVGGLIFPFLFIAVVISLILLVIKKSRWGILSAIALLLSWQQLSVIMAFGKMNDDEHSTIHPESTLRVMSWGVNKWDEANKKRRGGQSYRGAMLNFIEMHQPDVMCLQEFFESKDPKRFEPTIVAIEKMGYPYHIFFPTSELAAGGLQFGLAIFSKLPILDSGMFRNEAQMHSEGLCFIDVGKSGHRVRIFNTHLESAGFDKKDYLGEGQLKASGTILRKLKNGYGLRNLQADLVNDRIKNSPFSVILCGDLADIPNSYAYFTTRGNLNDAFLKKGAGIGRTFKYISPTLRIDYIFSDKRLNVENFYRFKVPYSDHYPIMADFELGGLGIPGR